MPDMWLTRSLATDLEASGRTELASVFVPWVRGMKLLATRLADTICGSHTIPIALTGAILGSLIAIVISGIKGAPALCALNLDGTAFPERVFFATTVFARMFCSCNEDKIFKSIVRFDPVDVMYNLIGT